MGDEESSGNSVATSSATPLINWWDLHANSLSSWNTHHHHPPPNPHSNNSSSCCEDQDISVSTSFAVDDESSHRRLIDLSAPSPDNNHLWTHVLLGVGSNEELQNSEAGGENLMDAVSCKSMMYEPACNYLKKLDTTWEYNHTNNNNSSPINSTSTFDQKHFNGFNEAVLDQSERLSKLVTTWSIAPPDPQVHNHNNNSAQFDPHQTHNNNDNTVTLNSSIMDHSGVFSSYSGLDMKVKHEHHHHHHAIGYQNNGFNSQYGMPTSLSSSCSRNLTDVISFTGRIGRPIIGIHALKPSFRPPSSMTTVSDSKKHGAFQTSLPTRTSNGRGQGSSTEVKKKRTDDSSSEPISKKPKQETSTASSTKVQAPKVKLGDRITTLQQIVSPFGKTDTASVLFEAIGYIKFLQEQVQLLSNSYMKTNSHHHKQQERWGSMERKVEEKGDLKSRGLCLVPISLTPQAYRDSTAPDYWTPAYRGCLFR